MKHDQQTVSDIDETRREYFTRNPDRPQGRVRTRIRQPVELAKAKSRMRTAAWRRQNDGRKKPETYHCAVQFLESMLLVVRGAGFEGLEDFRETEKAFQHALATLEQRGFDKEQAKAVFKRWTRLSR